MDKYYIPQHLDMPFKVIIWTLDEVMAFLIPTLLLFIMFNALLTGIVIGIASLKILKKVKGEEGHYFLAYLAYWYLPPIVKYKATPPSYIRELLG
jgi:conjugal transfer pilus assembly protein TraL